MSVNECRKFPLHPVKPKKARRMWQEVLWWFYRNPVCNYSLTRAAVHPQTTETQRALGGIFAAINNGWGKLWCLLTVFHQRGLSAHALSYSTPHKATGTSVIYSIYYRYSFLLSFSSLYFGASFAPGPSLDVEKDPFICLEDHWDQFPGQTGRQHQVAAEAAARFSLSRTRSPGEKKGEFCPIIQHHSGFGAVFLLLMGRFLTKGGKYSSYWSVIDEQHLFCVDTNVPARDKIHS